MWQRFTERARKVVFYAQEEAQRFGEGYVSTEHLLLGLVREPDSVAVRVLERLGVSPSRVKAEVEKQLPQGEPRSSQDMTLTPRAKRAIDLAYHEARSLHNNHIGTEHLLLGLVIEGDGLAGRVLEKVGVRVEQARLATIYYQSDEGKAEQQANAKPSFAANPSVEFRRYWQRLTMASKETLVEAVDFALAANWPVCAGHVVVALLSKECVGARAASLAGVDIDRLCKELTAHFDSKAPDGSRCGDFTMEATELVDAAVGVSERLGAEHVGTEHLLLAAIASDADGFAQHGLSYEGVVGALKALLQ